MDRRLELQALLEQILGSTNVYFQPPSNVQMEYPCIRYEWDDMDTKFADNRPYSHKKRYQVTHMDRKPTSTVPDKLADLPLCSFSTRFAADNLNHTIFSLYF